jgi:hypothetical protein
VTNVVKTPELSDGPPRSIQCGACGMVIGDRQVLGEQFLGRHCVAGHEYSKSSGEERHQRIHSDDQQQHQLDCQKCSDRHTSRDSLSGQRRSGLFSGSWACLEQVLPPPRLRTESLHRMLGRGDRLRSGESLASAAREQRARGDHCWPTNHNLP